MRDIQQILDLWGAWAANDHSGVDWYPVAAGFKGLLPYSTKARLQCCDDDGMVIDSCVGRLKKCRPEEYELVVAHYILGISLRGLAKRRKCSDSTIRKDMQIAIGFVEAVLSMLDVCLEMERYGYLAS